MFETGPATESVVRATPARLKPLDAAGAGHPSRIRYVLYAALIPNLLSEDVLLAPASASVIPLPHQLKACVRAVSHDRVRFLLPDEVGLGKTSEAGLISLYERTGRVNLGHALETVVLLELERRGCETDYVRSRDGYEVDFFARDPESNATLIQVCTDVSFTCMMSCRTAIRSSFDTE